MKRSTSHARPSRCKTPEGLPHIGESIRKIIKDKKLTGTWLATQLGCDRTNVYKLLRKQSIDTMLLHRISLILEYDFFTLLSEEYKRQSSLGGINS